MFSLRPLSNPASSASDYIHSPVILLSLLSVFLSKASQSLPRRTEKACKLALPLIPPTFKGKRRDPVKIEIQRSHYSSQNHPMEKTLWQWTRRPRWVVPECMYYRHNQITLLFLSLPLSFPLLHKREKLRMFLKFREEQNVKYLSLHINTPGEFPRGLCD